MQKRGKIIVLTIQGLCVIVSVTLLIMSYVNGSYNYSMAGTMVAFGGGFLGIIALTPTNHVKKG